MPTEKIGSMKAVKNNNNMCYEHTSIGRSMRAEFPAMSSELFNNMVAKRVKQLSKSTDPDDKAYYKQLHDEALFGIPKPNTTRRLPPAARCSSHKQQDVSNGWQKFQKQYRPILKNKHKELKGGQITKRLSTEWKSLKLHFPEMVQRYSSSISEDPNVDELCDAFKKIEVGAEKPPPKIKNKPKIDYAAQEAVVRRSNKRKFSKLFPEETPAAALAASFDDSSTMVVDDEPSCEHGGAASPDGCAADSSGIDDILFEECITDSISRAPDPQVWGAQSHGWRTKKLEAERSSPQTLCKNWEMVSNTKATMSWFRGMGKDRCALKPNPKYTVGSKNILNAFFYSAVNDPTNKVHSTISTNPGYYTITITTPTDSVDLELKHHNFPAHSWIAH